MFLILQAARSLFTRCMANRTTAKASALEAHVRAADETVKEYESAKSPQEIADLVEVTMAARKAFDTWDAADTRASKWRKRRAKAVTPASRVPAYLAGKVDAALAGILLYPYVPEVTAFIQSVAARL